VFIGQNSANSISNPKNVVCKKSESLPAGDKAPAKLRICYMGTLTTTDAKIAEFSLTRES
jgi:hypothetical protein